MGLLGFVVGLIAGWMATSYIVPLLPIPIPCFYEVAIFCLVGPHVLIALVIGFMISKVLPI